MEVRARSEVWQTSHLADIKKKGHIISYMFYNCVKQLDFVSDISNLFLKLREGLSEM